MLNNLQWLSISLSWKTKHLPRLKRPHMVCQAPHPPVFFWSRFLSHCTQGFSHTVTLQSRLRVIALASLPGKLSSRYKLSSLSHFIHLVPFYTRHPPEWSSLTILCKITPHHHLATLYSLLPTFFFFYSRYHWFTCCILISVLAFAAQIYSLPLLLSANYICLVPIAHWLPARFGQWETLAEDWRKERRERSGYFSLSLSLPSTQPSLFSLSLSLSSPFPPSPFQAALTAATQSPSPRVGSLSLISPCGTPTYLLHQAKGAR